MSRKVRKIGYLVAGLGHRQLVAARWPAGAVAIFRKLHRLSSIRTDRETGGWVGISVAPMKGQG